MDESRLGGPMGGTERDGDADYRIREAEARLDRRLATLEAQRVRAAWSTKLLGAALLATLVALVLVLGRAADQRGRLSVESVSAREMTIRDDEGFERGRLATDAEGRSLLTLSDRDGRERVRITVLADGSPGVTINDPDARPRAVLGYLPDGTTNLVFADEHGISRAVFGLDSDGSTQALFADPTGAIRTLVGVDADGEPSVSTFEVDDGEDGGT